MHALIQPQVAAHRAMVADARRLAQLPGAIAEAGHPVRQRADRADVNDAARGLRIHRLAGEGINHRLAPALEEAELGLVFPFFQVADAAPAQDTALLVEQDQVADGVTLVLVAFRLDELRGAWAILHRLILQRALAALVADGTIERVIDQDEAQVGLAHGLHLLGVRAHDHPLGHAHRAGGVEPATARPDELHQAHAARAERIELGVRAEDRDLDAGRFGRIHHQRPRRHGYFDVVNGQSDLIGHNGPQMNESANSEYQAVGTISHPTHPC